MVGLDNMENDNVYPAWPHPHQTCRCFRNWGSFSMYLINYSSMKTIPDMFWPLAFALRKLYLIFHLIMTVSCYNQSDFTQYMYPYKLIMIENIFSILMLIWNSLNVFVILNSFIFFIIFWCHPTTWVVHKRR